MENKDTRSSPIEILYKGHIFAGFISLYCTQSFHNSAQYVNIIYMSYSIMPSEYKLMNRCIFQRFSKEQIGSQH